MQTQESLKKKTVKKLQFCTVAKTKQSEIKFGLI